MLMGEVSLEIGVVGCTTNKSGGVICKSLEFSVVETSFSALGDDATLLDFRITMWVNIYMTSYAYAV